MRNATCARCGEEGHEDSSCSQPEKIINCQDSHSAYSKGCPLWNKEKQIQYLKVTNSISFPEARKLAETADSQALHSYASAVKQSAINKTFTKLSQRDKDKPDSTKLPPNKPAIPKKTKKT